MKCKERLNSEKKLKRELRQDFKISRKINERKSNCLRKKTRRKKWKSAPSHPWPTQDQTKREHGIRSSTIRSDTKRTCSSNETWLRTKKRALKLIKCITHKFAKSQSSFARIDELVQCTTDFMRLLMRESRGIFEESWRHQRHRLNCMGHLTNMDLKEKRSLLLRHKSINEVKILFETDQFKTFCMRMLWEGRRLSRIELQELFRTSERKKQKSATPTSNT